MASQIPNLGFQTAKMAFGNCFQTDEPCLKCATVISAGIFTQTLTRRTSSAAASSTRSPRKSVTILEDLFCARIIDVTTSTFPSGSRQQAAGSKQQAAASRQQAEGSRQQAGSTRQHAAKQQAAFSKRAAEFYHRRFSLSCLYISHSFRSISSFAHVPSFTSFGPDHRRANHA